MQETPEVATSFDQTRPSRSDSTRMTIDSIAKLAGWSFEIGVTLCDWFQSAHCLRPILTQSDRRSSRLGSESRTSVVIQTAGQLRFATVRRSLARLFFYETYAPRPATSGCRGLWLRARICAVRNDGVSACAALFTYISAGIELDRVETPHELNRLY